MPSLLQDEDLEWEIDHAGVIHVKKFRSQTNFLPGYGTENFGVSPFKEKETKLMRNIFLGTLAVSAVIAWKKYNLKSYVPQVSRLLRWTS